jgi:hypothetical protein
MVLQLGRSEFLDEYFDYRPGEHLNAISPTGAGKTFIAYQCAQVAIRQNPQLDFTSLMPKPRSPETVKWARVLGLKETPEWPPQRWPLQDKPPGYVLWPRHRKDLPVEQRRALVAAQLRKCLSSHYWKGNCIVFADDIYVAAVLMGLNPECEEFYTAGRENNAGLWGANQKPSGTLGGGSVTTFSYNAPTHLLFGKDTDQRNIRRFGEIGGGIDPREIEAIVRNLRIFKIGGNPVSEMLYLDKRGPYMAVIGP